MITLCITVTVHEGRVTGPIIPDCSAYFTAIYTQEQRRREIAHKLEREDQEERLGAANDRRELIQNKQQMEKQILCFEEKIEVEKMVIIILYNIHHRISVFIILTSKQTIINICKTKSSQNFLRKLPLYFSSEEIFPI